MGFYSVCCMCCGQREVVEADDENQAAIKFDCVVHNSGCQAEIEVAPHDVNIPMMGDNGKGKHKEELH